MKNKSVFLDRDGTINVDKNYLYRKEDFEFLDGSLEGLKKLCDAGFMLFLVTNQSGIARGFFSELDFLRLNEWMISKLKNYGIDITCVRYCPHHPEAKILHYRKNCNCRKPATGMFQDIIGEFNIDTSNSFAIGDKERDLSICLETDVNGFLIYSEKVGQVGNITKISGGLFEAANIILKNRGGQ